MQYINNNYLYKISLLDIITSDLKFYIIGITLSVKMYSVLILNGEYLFSPTLFFPISTKCPKAKFKVYFFHEALLDLFTPGSSKWSFGLGLTVPQA